MSMRSRVIAVFTEVAAEQNKSLAPLTDQLGLLECGLDSLCFAIIVARLEDEFNIDPFAQTDLDFPVTVGGFIRLYENSAASDRAQN